MKAGWTISAVGHAAVLAWGLVAFATKPLNAPPLEFISTDIISAADFSQITNGIKTAPKAETPKPLVEKVAEAKPVEDTNVKGRRQQARDHRDGRQDRAAEAGAGKEEA